MTKKTDKEILFERMNKVAGMPLNEQKMFSKNNVADPTTKTWGDQIIQMLHYNNDEKVHDLFRRYARELKGKAPEDAANKFRGLTDYIQTTIANDSVFNDNTAEHFTNMHLPNHLLGKI